MLPASSMFVTIRLSFASRLNVVVSRTLMPRADSARRCRSRTCRQCRGAAPCRAAPAGVARSPVPTDGEVRVHRHGVRARRLRRCRRRPAQPVAVAAVDLEPLRIGAGRVARRRLERDQELVLPAISFGGVEVIVARLVDTRYLRSPRHRTTRRRRRGRITLCRYSIVVPLPTAAKVKLFSSWSAATA